MRKKMNRILLMSLAAVLSLTMATASVSFADVDPAPTGLKMVKSTKTVTAGKHFEAHVKVYPHDAEDDNIRWEIVNGKSVVKFTDDRDGDDVDLKALKPGTAKLRCYVKGTNIKAYMKIVVKSKYASNIKLASNSKTIARDSSFTAKVTRHPAKYSHNDLKWTVVSGTSVVKITSHDIYDDDVRVKALKNGKAKLRCSIPGTNYKAYMNVTVRNGKITRLGAANRTIREGHEFELEVKKHYGLRDKYVKWSIGNTNVVKFEDNDIHDEEGEFIAAGKGTTKVTCTNLQTGGKVVYNITVK